MALTDASRPFRFLDLPPELRNRIYELLLPDSTTFYIPRYSPPRFMPHTSTFKVKLLRVNRQVHGEWAPVLYGSLVFELGYAPTARAWLIVIGSMKQHIRHVRLAMSLNTQTRSVLHQLKQGQSLRLIELGRRLRMKPANEVAHEFQPFIKAVRKTHKAGADPIDMLKMIDVDHSTYDGASQGIKEMQRAGVAWIGSVRELVAKAIAQ